MVEPMKDMKEYTVLGVRLWTFLYLYNFDAYTDKNASGALQKMSEQKSIWLNQRYWAKKK